MSQNESEIIALVLRMKVGDQNALAELYQIFANRLYVFIRTRISDNSGAEDVLQEVFLKVWQGRNSLRVEGLHFSAWLYKIASNTVADFYRNRYSRPQTVELELGGEVAAPEQTERLTEQGFDAAAVQQAMQKLPTVYKQVIELRFYQDFSVEETAGILGKTNIAVRVLQHRALKKLDVILKKYNGYERE